MSVPLAQLSCAQCQQRKKKCSKTTPCTACLKSGIPCTPIRRTRLPRGRSGIKVHDKATLQDRIARLEAIVTRQAEPLPPILSEGHPGKTALQVDTFIAPEFWNELTDAVAGLKEVLHGDGSEPLDESPATSGDLDFDNSSLSSIPLSNYSSPMRTFWLSLELKQRLLEVYHYRVDPVFKVLHWPSTVDSIVTRLAQERYSESLLSPDPLESAIYFVAICSLSDHELEDRRALVVQARMDVELALTDAGYLTSTELPVLQAFVIYLAGLRACQANAQQWTLLPTAIRIGSAQGIPTSLHTAMPTFGSELKRRLWFCIGVLDLQCAFDRGTAPLLRSGDFPSPPLNVNDYDITQHSSLSTELLQGHSFTDMTFVRIVSLAGICQRRIVELEFSDLASSRGKQQAEVLAQFERDAQSMLSSCGPSPTVFQKFTWAVAQESSIAMKLLLHRPLHKRSKEHSQHTEIVDVLAMATEVLKRSQDKRGLEEFAPWAWFSWIKWYALAIVLVELCTARGQLADHAWIIAQVSYADYAEVVADTKRGLLWKPIERLMTKVRTVRNQVPLAPATASSDAFNVLVDQNQDISFFENVMHGQPNPVTMFDEKTIDTTFGEHDDGMSWIHWDLFTDEISHEHEI